jgi:hypothetical protein
MSPWAWSARNGAASRTAFVSLIATAESLRLAVRDGQFDDAKRMRQFR